MAGPAAFKVLTEFKFEVGSALVGSSNLQQSLDKVSNAAKDAQFQMARVGVGFMSSMGLGAGGVLGTLGAIVKGYGAAEAAQNKLAQQLFAQKGYFTGINNTNDAIRESGALLKKIGKDATTFGLNEGVFADAANVNIGMLGSAGVSPSKAVDFTRNLLKSAPSLGVDPGSLQQQTADILSGNLSNNSRAEQRLFAETTAFKDFIKKAGGMKKAIKKFNKEFTPHERFELLNEAMSQFTDNTTLLKRQANEMMRIVQKIKNAMFGFNGVFQGMGGQLAGLIKEALNYAFGFVDGDFRKMMGNITAMLKQIVPKFDLMLVRLQELSDVAGNFQTAGIGALVFQLGQMALQANLLNKLTGGAAFKGAKSLGKRAAAATTAAINFNKLGYWLGRGARYLLIAVRTFIKPVALILGLLTLFSRARAIAKVADAKAMPAIMAKFTKQAAILTSVMSILIKPFNDVLDWAANMISPLFRMSYAMDLLSDAFGGVMDIVVDMLGMLSGMTAIFMNPLALMAEGRYKDAMKQFSLGNMENNYTTGRDDFFKSVLKGAGLQEDGTGATSGTVQNFNGPLTVKQDFKEQMEPDRVAFTLVETLKKIGQNPTQANGQTIAVGRGGN